MHFLETIDTERQTATAIEAEQTTCTANAPLQNARFLFDLSHANLSTEVTLQIHRMARFHYLDLMVVAFLSDGSRLIRGYAMHSIVIRLLRHRDWLDVIHVGIQLLLD